jgi:Alg9-like mannosyltransferase family
MGSGMKTIRIMWQEKPLLLIMIAAIIFRAIAVLCAKGYGMSDDHFLVLEWAQGWLDGESIDRLHPAGHSLVYPGLHYLLLLGIKKLGLYVPELIMYIVRFLHAALSLLTVYFGYKLVLLRADKKIAAEAGLLLAILWVFPFMSVRNLIEMVCIPFLMLGAYFAITYEDSKKRPWALLVGVFLGMAFVFRYQTITFSAVMILIFVVRRDIRAAALAGAGFFISTFLIQGMTDLIAYGYPYASFKAYYLYNKANATNYVTLPWYTYIGTIAGVLIPPTSLLLMYGYFRTWKRWAIIFWPVLAFLVFHSAFPNKQERFILPVLPFVLLLGIVGWQEFVGKSPFWRSHQRLHSGLWKWFWAINCILLVVVSTTYSKRVRVETMRYLYNRGDVKALVLESSDNGIPIPPLFYLGKRVPVYYLPLTRKIDSLRAEIVDSGVTPNYIVMMNQKHIEERKERLKGLFPEMASEVEISPSFIDRLLHFLNPTHNINQQCSVFSVNPASFDRAARPPSLQGRAVP